MRYLFILLSMFLFVSCQEDATGTLRADEIPTEIKSQVQQQNDLLISAIHKGEVETIEEMLSPDLVTNPSEVKGLVNRIQPQVPNANYKERYGYFVVNKGENEAVSILSQDTSDRAFQIRFTGLTKESYASILQPVRDGDQIWMFVLYGRYEEGWKINVLKFGRHILAGQDAIGHYQIALEEDKKGHITNAINRMVLAGATSTPAQKYFQYLIADEMQTYNDTLIKRALERYPMPMEVQKLPTAPSIFKVSPQRVKDKISTMVKYKSQIPLTDSVALSAENQALHALIPEIFDGIDEDVPFVFYRAYNEFPDDGTSTPYYGFVRKTAEDQISPTQ